MRSRCNAAEALLERAAAADIERLLPIVAVSPLAKVPSPNTRLFTELLAARLRRERDL